MKKIFLVMPIIVMLAMGCSQSPIMESQNNQNDTQSPTAALESRDFSCDGFSGFIFKYPVFKNWEDIKITKAENELCSMEIGWSGFAEIPPMAPKEMTEPIKPPPFLIEIQKSNTQDPEWHSAAILTNVNGVRYRFLNDPALGTSEKRNFVEFYLKGHFIKIEALMIGDYYGFSANEFWQTIIQSFKQTE